MSLRFSRRHLLGGLGAAGLLSLGAYACAGRPRRAASRRWWSPSPSTEGGTRCSRSTRARPRNPPIPTASSIPATASPPREIPLINDALAATNGTGVFTDGGTGLSFGPSIPASLRALAPELCLVRGVDMGTLTHAVGKRYNLTGKFPKGS